MNKDFGPALFILGMSSLFTGHFTEKKYPKIAIGFYISSIPLNIGSLYFNYKYYSETNKRIKLLESKWKWNDNKMEIRLINKYSRIYINYMDRCVIRTIYCGNSKKLPTDTPSKKYSRKGTNLECMKKGFGASYYSQKLSGVSPNSLLHIKYIGEKFVTNFRKQGIRTINSLINKLKDLSAIEKRKIISRAVTRSNGIIDQRAFNGVVLFLHTRGLKKLPTCKIYKE